MLKKIFQPQSTGMAALILTFASVLSYILGMVRDIIFAGYYGAGLATDAYNASFLIPDAIFNFFVAGALTAAFIPVFSGYLNSENPQQREEAQILASSFLVISSLVVIIVAIPAFIFMPQIISWYFFDADSQKITLTIEMSRILLLSPLLFAISNTLGNILISQKRFVSYSLAPLFYNLGIIAGIFFLSKSFGIYAAAWGAVFGILLHLITRLAELIYSGFSFSSTLNIFHPGLRKIFFLMIPKTIGLMSWQVSLWSINFFGNLYLENGAVSAFYYARNLQSFPVSIFGIALATAVFPYLSDHASADRKEIFTHQFDKSLRQILFLTLPAGLAIFILAKPIITVVYGRGEFDSSDINLTADVLALFALSIPLESVVHLVARAYYAHKNTIIPVIGSLILMLSVVLGSYIFSSTLGAVAFSLFFTVGCLFQLVWLFLLIGKKVSNFNFKSFLNSIFKIAFCLFLMLIAIKAAELIVSNTLYQLVLQVVLGGAAYIFAALIIRCDELSEAKKILQKQLGKKFKFSLKNED